MKRRLPFLFLVLCLFLDSGCAPPLFKRSGSPQGLAREGKTATALHGLPNMFVNIDVGGQKTGAWLGVLLYGPVGWLANAAATSSDKSENQEILDALIRHGLREYIQTSIADTFSGIMARDDIRQAPSVVFLDSSTEGGSGKKVGIPITTEILTVDSQVAFYVAFSSFPSGATKGVVTELTIRVRYLSSGAERRTIWEDAFMCELEPSPFGESLVENNAYRAKQQVGTAIGRLKPWIQNELRMDAYDRYQRIIVRYKYPRYSGLIRHKWMRAEGWLLQDRDGILVIRQINGITRVLPREFIKDMEYVR